MPNIKSAKKRVSVTATKTLENKAVKSRLKGALKKYNIALNQKDFKLAEQLLPGAISMIDTAKSKGILHKNCAARKKAQVYGNLATAKIRAKADEEAAKIAQKNAEKVAKEHAEKAAAAVEPTTDKKVGTKKAASKKDEPKKVEAKKEDKKSASKKDEPKKVAAKKDDSKKSTAKKESK